MHCLQIFKHAYSNRAKLSDIEIISANLMCVSLLHRLLIIFTFDHSSPCVFVLCSSDVCLTWRTIA